MLVVAMMMSGMMMGQQCQKGQQCAGAQCHTGQHKQMDAQEMALMKAKMLREKLSLDEKQYNEVFLIYEKHVAEVRELKADAAGVQQDSVQIKQRREAIMKCRQALAKQMQKVLNEVQFAEWKMLENKPKMQHHHGMKDAQVAHKRGPAMRTMSDKPMLKAE